MIAHNGSQSCLVAIADTVVAASNHRTRASLRLRDLKGGAAGTATYRRGHPRARQVIGCGHRLVVAMLALAPPALLHDQRRRCARPSAGTAGTSNNRARASLRRRDVSAGPAGIVFHRRGHRPRRSAGTSGTSNNGAREPPRRRDVSAGTPGPVFYRRGHRPWRSAGTSGTSNNKVREPPRRRDVSAGTPDPVF